jgi:hypothetical protein
MIDNWSDSIKQMIGNWSDVFISEEDLLSWSIIQAISVGVISVLLFKFSFETYISLGSEIVKISLLFLLFYLIIFRWLIREYVKEEDANKSGEARLLVSLKSKLQMSKSLICQIVKSKPAHVLIRAVVCITASGILLQYSPPLPPILTSLMPLLTAALITRIGVAAIDFFVTEITDDAQNFVFLIVGFFFLCYVRQIIYNGENLGLIAAYVQCLQIPVECGSAVLDGRYREPSSLQLQSEITFNGIFAVLVLLLVGFTKSWSVFATWVANTNNNSYSWKKHIRNLILPNAMLYDKFEWQTTYLGKLRKHALSTLIEWIKWTIGIVLLLPPLLIFADYLISGPMHRPSTHAVLIMAAVLSQTVVVLVIGVLTPPQRPPWIKYDFKMEGRAPPTWLSNYRLPQEDRIETDIQQKREEIETLEDELNSLTSYKRLLYETSSNLEEIVRESLRNLGFSVEDEVPGKRDGILHTSQTNFVLEITGTTGGIKLSKCRQLDDWVENVTADSPDENMSGLLIVNPEMATPPQERDVNLEPNVERYLNRRGDYKVLTTVDLYRLVELNLQDDIDTTIVEEMFNQEETLLSLPPELSERA